MKNIRTISVCALMLALGRLLPAVSTAFIAAASGRGKKRRRQGADTCQKVFGDSCRCAGYAYGRADKNCRGKNKNSGTKRIKRRAL